MSSAAGEADAGPREQIARLLFRELAIARGHGPDEWHELWDKARDSVRDQVQHAHDLADEIIALLPRGAARE